MFPWQCTFIDDQCQPCDGPQCQPCDLHTEESRQEEFDERADEIHAGISTWFHGFTGVPCVSRVNPASICPFDFMHTTAQGMWKHELPAFLFAAIKRRKWFSEDQWRQAFTQYPWPKEQGMPPIPTSTFLEGRRVDGKSGSYPKINIHFHWTAAQVSSVPPLVCAHRASPVRAPLLCVRLSCACASRACASRACHESSSRARYRRAA